GEPARRAVTGPAAFPRPGLGRGRACLSFFPRQAVKKSRFCFARVQPARKVERVGGAGTTRGLSPRAPWWCGSHHPDLSPDPHRNSSDRTLRPGLPLARENTFRPRLAANLGMLGATILSLRGESVPNMPNVFHTLRRSSALP